MKKDLSFLNKIKIAHRGLWNEENPENSIGAFNRSIERGIPIEFDVHLLKDDTLVVFHDSNLIRMTGKNIVLKNSLYNDIKDFKLKDTDYKIPTLKEVRIHHIQTAYCTVHLFADCKRKSFYKTSLFL